MEVDSLGQPEGAVCGQLLAAPPSPRESDRGAAVAVLSQTSTSWIARPPRTYPKSQRAVTVATARTRHMPAHVSAGGSRN